MGTKKRTRGAKYPVEFVASELGVDRKALIRRLEEIGIIPNGAGITFREAFRGLSNREEEKQEALATKRTLRESAQIDTLHKKGQFVFRTDHANAIKDAAVQTRVTIERASYIPRESRKRLIDEVSEIRLTVAEPSNKK